MPVSPEDRLAEARDLFSTWKAARRAEKTGDEVDMVEVFNHICDRLEDYIPEAREGDQEAARIAHAWDELQIVCAGLVPVDASLFPEGFDDFNDEFPIDWENVFGEVRYNFPMIEAAKLMDEGYEQDFAEVLVGLYTDQEHLSERVQSLPLIANALAQAGVVIEPWVDDSEMETLTLMSEVDGNIIDMKNLTEAKVLEVNAAVSEAFRVSRMAHADIVDYSQKSMGLHHSQFDAEALKEYAETKESSLRLDLARIAEDLSSESGHSVSDARLSQAFRDAEILRLTRSIIDDGTFGKATPSGHEQYWNGTGLSKSEAMSLASAGIPIAAMSDATLLRTLARSSNPVEKMAFLCQNIPAIIAGCVGITGSLESSMPKEAKFIQEAIQASQSGMWSAAQALATNVMDSELTRIRKVLLGVTRDMTVGEFVGTDITARPVTELIVWDLDLTSVAILLATAKAIYHGFANETSWANQEVTPFHRNTTAHNVNGRQYNRLNATLAIMMACAATLERSRYSSAISSRSWRRAA